MHCHYGGIGKHRRWDHINVVYVVYVGNWILYAVMFLAAFISFTTAQCLQCVWLLHQKPPPHPSCSVCDHITNRVFELNIELPYVLGWIGGTATQQCWPLQSCFASFIQLLFRCCEYNLKEASQTRGVLSLQSCADYGMCAGYGKCVGRAMNWLQTTIVIVLTQQLCAGPGMCVGPHRE